MNDKVLARWESKSGKHWVELTQSESGAAFYNAPQAVGSLGMVKDIDAIAEMQKRVDLGYFQPDANKTPMKRVA
jgi:hypothetical protein